MPLVCTSERMVCFAEGAECAMTLSDLTSISQNRNVRLATLETSNTDGLCIRVIEGDSSTEKLPLYVTRGGRCVFNCGDIVDDTDPDLASSAVRVHGVLKADAYEGLPVTVTRIEMDPDGGNIVYTTSDDVRHDVPLVSRKLDNDIAQLKTALDKALEQQAAAGRRIDDLERRLLTMAHGM